MSYFQQNRSLLESRFGSMENLFADERSEDDWEVEISRSGLPWAKSRGVSLCSRHDPLKEARRLMERHRSNFQHFCFLGLGLGYLPQACAEKTPEGLILIIVESRNHFRQALSCRDLSVLINHKRIYFLVQQQPQDFALLLKDLQIGEWQIFRHRVLYEQHKEYFKSFDDSLKRWLDRKEVNRNTLKRFGGLWIRNFAANLPLLTKALPLEALKGQFSGYSAVIAAAGPSLEDLLPYLKDLPSEILLISVDTAFRTLRREGIMPHILIITDPQYWNSRHLDFCQTPLIMVSDSSTHPRVFQNHRGPLFFSASPFPLAAVFESPYFTEKLRSGGSVATAAWDLARLLGCKTINMAGLDLGYPSGMTHCRGSYFEERTYYLNNRVIPLEQLSWEALHSAPLMEQMDYEGRKILTDQRMNIYIQWFQETLKDQEVPTYNLSPKGVRIQGIPYREPQDLFRKSPRNNSLDSLLEVSTHGKSSLSESHLKVLIEEVIQGFEKAQNAAEKGQEYSKKLYKAFYKQQDLQPILEQLNQIDLSLGHLSVSEAAGFLIQPLLEELIARQSDGNPAEILKNSSDLYREMTESLKFHKEILKLLY